MIGLPDADLLPETAQLLEPNFGTGNNVGFMASGFFDNFLEKFKANESTWNVSGFVLSGFIFRDCNS